MHFHGRSIGRFTHPEVQVPFFPSLKEESIIAVVEFGKLVKLVEFGFRVELGVFAAVRKEGGNVVQKMSVSIPYMMVSPTRFVEQSPEILYLYVIPLEDNINTRCLFFFTPFAGPPSLWPLLLDKDL